MISNVIHYGSASAWEIVDSYPDPETSSIPKQTASTTPNLNSTVEADYFGMLQK